MSPAPLLWFACLVACLSPYVSAAVALVLGVVLAQGPGAPYPELTRRWTPRLLAWAVVGLGAGMDLRGVLRVGAQGVGYTFMGITTTLALGLLLGRLLRVPSTVSTLVAVGTAICGGSAIAAVAPVLRAKSEEVAVALGTVFMLNAVALWSFPPLGHALGLTPAQFGLWSALAIHDTSSVVGATLAYAPEAVQVGTTVKLARALWIVPVTLGVAQMVRRGGGDGGRPPVKKPWFILGFLGVAAAVTYLPGLRPAGTVVQQVAQRLLVVSLFCIGSNLSRETLRSVGLRPLIQGLLLWAVNVILTLAAIVSGAIRL